MNSENLISLADRSDQAEIVRKGGIKSGEIRRRNKAIKTIINEIMREDIQEKEIKESLEKAGLEPTYEAAMAFGLIKRATRGDVRAFEAVMRYSGRDKLYNAQVKKLEADQEQAISIAGGVQRVIDCLDAHAAEDWEGYQA